MTWAGLIRPGLPVGPRMRVESRDTHRSGLAHGHRAHEIPADLIPGEAVAIEQEDGLAGPGKVERRGSARWACTGDQDIHVRRRAAVRSRQ